MRKTNPPSAFFSAIFKRYSFFILIAILALASFFLGFLSNAFLATRNNNFALFNEAYQLYLKHAYGDPPSRKEIEYGMIRGMLSASHDPFTVFMEPPQNELQSNQLQGRFGGIGVRIEQDGEGNILLYPLPESSAFQGGLIDGDRLRSVDDLSIRPTTTIDEVQAAIRGPINSNVRLSVERGSENGILEFKIRRLEVAVPSVTYNVSSIEPTVGVIQINVIAESTADEISRAIAILEDQGVTAYVLDLRNNGGGLVEGGIKCANLFLENNLVIMEEKFNENPVKTYRSNRDGPYVNTPIILLVNQNTASAAEIFAGALQHHRRAQIIGSMTYGKDSVQMVFDLSDGSSIHVTAGKWWLPGQSGAESEEKIGLTPDIEITPEEASEPGAVEAAVKQLIP